MPYWVYGQKADSGEEASAFFSRAATRDNAIAEAREAGIIANSLEYTESGTRSLSSAPVPPTLRTRFAFASVFVVFFRILAVLALLFGCVLFPQRQANPFGFPDVYVPDYYWRAALQHVCFMVVVVAMFLYLAEVMRLLIAIEGNSRVTRNQVPSVLPAHDSGSEMGSRPHSGATSAKKELTQEDCLAEGLVSIWLGDISDEDELDSYMHEGFSADFGFAIDPENGPEIDVSREIKPIGDLLEGFSFWQSYTESAVEAAERVGRANPNCVVVFYNLRYKTEHIAFQRRLGLTFLGTFEFEDTGENE